MKFSTKANNMIKEIESKRKKFAKFNKNFAKNSNRMFKLLEELLQLEIEMKNEMLEINNEEAKQMIEARSNNEIGRTLHNVEILNNKLSK